MSTYYSVSKCKHITFAKDISYIDKSKIIGKQYFVNDFEELNSLDKTKTYTFIIDAKNSIFDDIEIEIDKEKEGQNSKKDKTQDVKKDMLLGGGKQLEAFANNKFTVINGKRNASIQPVHQKQNHEVIDTIARNGILVSPLPTISFSIGILFNILRKFDTFALVIIHPSLIVDSRDSNYPSEYVEPAFIIGEGEICAVFYRYICLYFYGYLGVYDDDDRERNYDI